MRLDLLLTHTYLLADDPREREIMRPFPPLGIQYLVAWLRRETAWRVDWFDTTFSASIEELYDHVRATDPRVVGMYGHTITRPVALALAPRLRAEGRLLIAGGPDPAQYVDEYLAAGFHVVVIGEGEITLQALMDHLGAHDVAWSPSALSAIEGIAFLGPDGQVVRTPPRELIRPLERLPWPHRERRDLDAYLGAWRERHGETALSISTSRGCPYHCAWCSKQVYGDTFRRRSVDDVIDEIVYLRETFAPDQLWFVDDVFSINRRWVHRFCEAMVERGTVMPFYLVARPEAVDPEMLGALARAGCYRVYLSAESGSQHVLDAMHKDSRVDDIHRAAGMLRAAGIELGVFVMLGYPGEELDDVKRTLAMLHALKPEVTLLSVAHPMKGTAFYEQVADDLVEVPGWEEANGGRLAFRMRYPHAFYEVAQRHFWTETGLARKVRERRVDRELARLMVRWPVYKAAFELLGRTPPPRGFRPVFRSGW